MKSDPAILDAYVDTWRAQAPGLVRTQMFGVPCAKLADGKPVISWFDNAMAFKLGADRVNDMIAGDDSCQPFDPSGKGRPFKDWVLVSEDGPHDWDRLALDALGLT